MDEKLKDKARSDYIVAIRKLHQSLILTAEHNEEVLRCFNRCCEVGLFVQPVHWHDMTADRLQNGRITQWARGVGHNLGCEI